MTLDDIFNILFPLNGGNVWMEYILTQELMFNSGFILILSSLLLISSLFSLLLLFFTFKYHSSNYNYKKFIQPLLIISLANAYIRVTQFITLFVLVQSDFHRGFILTDGVYLAFPYIFFFYSMIKISLYYVKIPLVRKKRWIKIVNLLRFYLIALMVTIITKIIALKFSDTINTVLNSFLLILIFLANILLLMMTSILRKESQENASKVMRIRISMINGYIVIFTMTTFINTIILALLNLGRLDGSPFWFYIFYILQGLAGLGISIMIFWSMKIPKWARKKYLLVIPDSMSW